MMPAEARHGGCRALAVCLLVAASAAHALPIGNSAHTLEFGGVRRTYLVHLPPAASAGKPLPVVLAFHGGGVNAESMARFSGLSDKADRSGFIAVYPSGTGRLSRVLTWNAGNCCGYAERRHVDDVGFVRRLLDDLATVATVDPRRVYATGISNGGMFTHRLACELSDRIAAIASVSGPIGIDRCRPTRSVPVMHFHGTADRFAPFAGGRGERSLSSIMFYSVEHTIGSWVTVDGCSPTPTTEALPDRVADGTHVTRKTYAPCRDGAEVVLYTIHNGGHTWPGRQPRFGFLGRSTANVDANDTMWEFFLKHPLPLVRSAGVGQGPRLTHRLPRA